MPYNPSLHTTTNKPLGVAQGVPTDARSEFYDEVNFKYRPYISTSEAIGYLNTTNSRKGNFPVFINSTGSLANGVITGGDVVEYYFKPEYTNTDLVVRNPLPQLKTINGNSVYGSGNIVIEGATQGGGNVAGGLWIDNQTIIGDNTEDVPLSAVLPATIVSNSSDTFTSRPKIEQIVSLTQAEYDGITPNSNTLYLIT